ncbi:MAG: hypothetical protein AB7I27_04045 [Bacteriovoracaceae bacterium]
MMNLIQKFLSKNPNSKIRNNFNHYFFSLPEHQWILNSPAKKHFERLFQHLPAGLLEILMTKNPVVFIPNHHYREGQLLTSTVVIFPKFQDLLKTSKNSAVAYLAQELGYIIYELENTNMDPLMAEIEADKFVCDLGLANELEELLLAMDETIEKRLRLTYLTINYFSSEQV